MQQHSFGEVGALLVSGLLVDLEQLVPQGRAQPRSGELLHGPGDHALLLRVQQRTADQAADLHVPLAFGSGTFVEQVVDVPAAALFASGSRRIMEQVVDVPVLPLAHAPVATVSGRIAEQVVDVPEPRFAPDFGRRQQPGRSPARSAAAWLEAPQGQLQGVFRTFPRGKKSATVASQSTANMQSHSELGAQSSSSMSGPPGNLYTDADGYVWYRVDTGQWKKLGTDILQDVPWR